MKSSQNPVTDGAGITGDANANNKNLENGSNEQTNGYVAVSDLRKLSLYTDAKSPVDKPSQKGDALISYHKWGKR